MGSGWVDLAIATVPGFAIVGFLTGFSIWSAAWLCTRLEGCRAVSLPMSIGIGLLIGLWVAVLAGAIAALLGYLILLPLPQLLWEVLASILEASQANYLDGLGIFMFLLSVVTAGCVWSEAGRDPPPSVDSPFSPLAYQEHVIWSYLIDDAQLAPAFRALRRPKDAFEIFRNFADLGNAAAQNNLGVMFETGWGVAKSDVQAEKYFRLASEQGISTAQFSSAALLAGDILGAAATEHDTAAERRLVEGYKWALVAKAQHFPDVKLRRFRKRLNAAQRAEGERLARLWLEQHGVRKQNKLMFLIKNAPLVLTREIWGARRGGVAEST